MDPVELWLKRLEEVPWSDEYSLMRVLGEDALTNSC